VVKDPKSSPVVWESTLTSQLIAAGVEQDMDHLKWLSGKNIATVTSDVVECGNNVLIRKERVCCFTLDEL